MITGCEDSAVRVFQIDNGRLMFSLYGHKGSVDFIEVCDDYIITAGSDRYVLITWLQKDVMIGLLSLNSYEWF